VALALSRETLLLFFCSSLMKVLIVLLEELNHDTVIRPEGHSRGSFIHPGC
jgi:hypothetical protein